MNCYISQITVFNNIGDSRKVILESGLNIITGDSKTGKSALLEIIDYCFCSKTSGIPKGKISEFGYLFSIVLTFPEKHLIIGRKNYREGGASKLYVRTERNNNSKIELTLDYFEEQKPFLKKEAQREIEQNLNMSVANIAQSEDVDNRKKRKTSIREMTSFIFQHQNLIANKHALFFRFDDNIKRQAVIDSFPVFAGWVSEEYYALKRELDAKRKELRFEQRNVEKQRLAIEGVKKELKGYFRNYFNIIGKQFNESLSFQDLLKLKNNLPDYTSKTFISDDIQRRYNILKKEREEKSSERSIIDKQIRELEETELYANSFDVSLQSLKIKAENSQPLSEKYNCPVCGEEHKEINFEIQKIIDANDNVKEELQQLGGYKISYQKEKDILKKTKSEFTKEIKLLSNQIGEIEDLNLKIKEEKNISQQAIYAKAQLDLRLDIFMKEQNIKISDGTEEIKSNIEALEIKLKDYSIDREFNMAEAFLSKRMNKIAEGLDFEEELAPTKFHFELKEFQFYHMRENPKERIYLSEMGSGANWLTCHISLFLGLLHYFAVQKNSVIPSILFIDQPSQVYFPSEFGKSDDKDNDIKQVEKVYSAILDELKIIGAETDFYPQVIVTDHADNLDLGEHDFNDHVRKRWKPNNDGALI